jgi:3-deoxy-manno-octulosonate cytidylyltransferase (CMP-KDO synthetase)
MKIIGLIPARMKSSRFPGKPLVNILGKPMIYWVYTKAIRIAELDEVYVVTEDRIIDEKCKELSIPCLLEERESEVALERLSRVSRKLDGDIYLNIQGDEPLMPCEAIKQIIDGMLEDPKVYYLGLRSAIMSETDFVNCNNVKVIVDNKEYALYFSRSKIPFVYNPGNAFRVLGLYGYRAEFIKQFADFPKSNLEKLECGIEMLRAMEMGYRIKVIKTSYHSLGVDTPEDVALVEDIMKEKY